MGSQSTNNCSRNKTLLMEVFPLCQTKMFHLNIMFHLEAAETGGVNFLGGGHVKFPIVNVIICLGESSKKARGKFFIDGKVKIRCGSL